MDGSFVRFQSVVFLNPFILKLDFVLMLVIMRFTHFFILLFHSIFELAFILQFVTEIFLKLLVIRQLLLFPEIFLL